MKKFSSLVILLFVMYLCVAVTPKEEKINHTLKISEQRDIVNQIGISGYKELIKNGCSTPIAEKINTGEWRDSWCAKHYKHLEL